MQTVDIIKGGLLATSMTLLLIAANMAHANESTEIPTANTYIKRGDVISENMLTTMTWSNGSLPDYVVADAGEIIGMEATRNVREGKPLYRRLFKEPDTVKKGQIVPVIFKKGGISLTTDGSVMEDAIAGASVRVMNDATNRILTGVVQKNGTIIVN